MHLHLLKHHKASSSKWDCALTILLYTLLKKSIGWVRDLLQFYTHWLCWSFEVRCSMWGRLKWIFNLKFISKSGYHQANFYWGICFGKNWQILMQPMLWVPWDESPCFFSWLLDFPGSLACMYSTCIHFLCYSGKLPQSHDSITICLKNCF